MSTYNQNPSYSWCARSQISDCWEPDTECATVCQKKCQRNCTEHKPGYLHAATQWTHTATATTTPLHLTHMNVTTNVNGMSLYHFM